MEREEKGGRGGERVRGKMEGRGMAGRKGRNEGHTTTEGERRGWKGIRGRSRDGRGGEGICWTNIKLLPTRLQRAFIERSTTSPFL